MSCPRPVVAPPQPWQFPLPQTMVLENGLSAYLYDIPGQHIVNVRLLLPIPYLAEPRQFEGVAELYAHLLPEGTRTLPEGAFAQALEEAGVGLGAAMSETCLRVELDAASDQLDTGLQLLTQALLEPEHSPQQIARLVSTRLSDIEQERAVGATVAMQSFARTFFAGSSRASRPAGGTPITVQAIDVSAVHAWHARAVAASGAKLVIAGQLSNLELPALLERSLGRLPAHGSQVLPQPALAPRRPEATGVYLVDRPGAVQSEIVVGCVGPDRGVAGGWAPYPALGYAIGGSPTARVDAVLREDKGYTYGLRSGFRPRSHGGTFLTSGSVRADVTGQSVRLLHGILDEVTARPLSDQELAAAVDYLTLTAPGRYETAEAIADEVASLLADRRELAFTSEVIASLRELTPGQVAAAWQQNVTRDWTTIVVGDADCVEPQLISEGIAVTRLAPPPD